MEHWNEYWTTSNSVHSFSEGQYSKGYDGELRSIWNAVFNSLPKSAQGIDIGCGNGGLALLAVQSGNNFDMYGCDAANIMPLASVDTTQEHFKMLPQITFCPNMKAEDLSFEDNHFDFALSQFGIEYSDLNLSIPQVLRVLKPGGRFIAMLHHKNSFVTENSKIGLKVLNDFLKKDSIVDQLHAFVTFYSSSVFTSNMHLEENSRKFKSDNSALLDTFKNLQKHNMGDINTHWYNDVSKMLVPFIMSWQNYSITDYEQTIASLMQFTSRLREQINTAKSLADIKDTKATAQKSFSSATYKPIRLEEGLFAWCIELTK